MPHVLNASSLLAFLHHELGSDTVARVLDSAQVPAVNWAEVLQKSLWRQVDIKGMLDMPSSIFSCSVLSVASMVHRL